MRRGAVVVTLALLALAGCGGGEDHSEPSVPTTSSAQQAVLQAGARTQEVKSARISFTGTVTGGPASGTMTGEGVFAGRQGHMSMDLSGLAGGGQLGGRMEVVFDELVFYMKFPPEIARQLPGGKAWVKFDLGELGKREGIDIEQLFQLSGTDPSQSLGLLRAASADFREAGTEPIRGVETTHYRGTVDLEKVAQQAPEATRESYRRIIESSGQRRVPVDVWIDDEGLTRRMRYEQKLPDGSTMDLTQEYYDFGVDVDVTPPPADEVVDLTQLLGGS